MIKPAASGENTMPGRQGIAHAGDQIPRWELLALGLILMLALALRIYHLGYKSLWLDEVVYVRSAQLGGLFGPYGYASISHPPGYLFLLRVLSSFGRQEWWLRLPALVASVGGVVVLWALGRSTVGPISGLMAALLLSLSAIHVGYAQEVHSYALFGTLSTIQLWALYRSAHPHPGSETARSHQRGALPFWAIFVAAATANLYIHYYALVPVGLSLIVYPCFLLAVDGGPVSSLWKDRPKRRGLLSLLIALTSIGLLYLPQILSGLLGSARIAGDRSVAIDTGILAPEVEISPDLFGDTLLAFISNRQPWTLDLWLVLLMATSLLLGMAWLLWRKPPIGAAYLVWMTLPLPLIAWFVYRAGFSFAPRRLLFILPVFLLVAATGMTTLLYFAKGVVRRLVVDRPSTGRAFMTLAAGLLVAGVIWGNTGPLWDYYQRPKQDWRTLASILETVPKPGDAVVILPSAAPPLEWYYDTTQARVIDDDLVQKLEDLCTNHGALYVATAETGAQETEAEAFYLQQSFIPIPLRLLTLYYRNCQPGSWYGQGAAPLFELAYDPSLPNQDTKRAQERFAGMESAAQQATSPALSPLQTRSQLMDLSSAAVPMPADPVTGLLDLFLYQALVDPADSAALTRLGAFLAQVQNLEDAQVFLQQAVERDPQNWLAYALWAHYLDAAGQDAEALAVIQNGRTAAPRNPSLDLPKIRLEGGEVVESPALSKAIEQGRLALRQKNWDAAISVGQSAVTQYPNRYETHLLVGDVFRAQGDLAQAAAAYQDAISLAPYLSFLHGRLAEVLARSGLGQEALQFALNAVAIDQGRWENWLALGQAYTALAEEDLSKLAWAETVLLHAEDLAPPESQAPQQALAELDERHGMTNLLASQPPTAEEIEKAVIEDRQGQRDLAQRLLQAGQSGQALILFQALARTDSQDRESRMGLAAALAAEDRVDEAMVEYDQISSDWPDFPYARVHQGTLLEQEGNLPGAIASYRSAVAVAPTNPDTHLVLAYALRKSGDVEEAIAHFEAGLALDPTRTAAQRALDTLRIGEP